MSLRFLILALLFATSQLCGIHLSQFPEPFVLKNAESPINFELVLPREPSTSEIETAMQLTAYLSRQIPFEHCQIHVKLGNKSSDNNQIVILDKATETDIGTGFLSLQMNELGFWKLLIEGDNAEGLDKALAILENPKILTELHLDTLAVHQYPPKEMDSDQKITLEQLGHKKLLFAGTHKQKASFHVTPPFGEKLSPETYAAFQFRHSLLLDPKKSNLEIFVNGHLLGNIPLTDENADEGHIKFPIPANVLSKRDWNFDVLIKQELESDMEPDVKHAWTIVEGSSSIHFVESIEPVEASLANFPGIFSAAQAQTHEIVLCVPDEPSESTLTAALQIAALGGKNNWYPIKWKVVRGQDLSVHDQKAPSLIFLGTDRDVMEWKILGMKIPSVKEWQGALIPIPSPWRKDQALYTLVTKDESECPKFLKKLFTSNLKLNIKNQMAVMDKDYHVETKYIPVAKKKTQSLWKNYKFQIGSAVLAIFALIIGIYFYQKK